MAVLVPLFATGMWPTITQGQDSQLNWRWTTFTGCDGLASDNVTAVYGGGATTGQFSLSLVRSGREQDGSRDDAPARNHQQELALNTTPPPPEETPASVHWTTFDVTDGLASNNVNAIWSDGQSLWVATDQGLSHWDGIRWTTFTETDGLAHSLVIAVAGNAQGKVWAATVDGLSHRTGAGWQMLGGGQFYSIWVDGAGSVWVPSPVGELTQCDPRRETKPCRLVSRPSISLSHQVTEIWGDDEGTLWAQGNGCLSRCVEEGAELRCHFLLGRLDQPIRAVWYASSGQLWAATKDEVRRCHPPTAWRDCDLVVTTLERSEDASTDHGPVLALRADLESGALTEVWAAPEPYWYSPSGPGIELYGRQLSDAALSRWHGTGWTTFRSDHGVPQGSIKGITYDGQGGTWVGASGVWDSWNGVYVGGGLSHWNQNRWTTLNAIPGMESREVLSIWGEKNGALWLGLGQGLVYWDGSTWHPTTATQALEDRPITVLDGDEGGLRWVGTGGSGLLHRDGGVWTNFTSDNTDNRLGNVIKGLWIEGSNTVWIVARYRLSRCVLQDADLACRIIADFGEYESRSVSGTPDGVVWVATRGELLHCVTNQEQQVDCASFTRDQGLPEKWNELESVWTEPAGIIWLVTSTGVRTIPDSYEPCCGVTRCVPHAERLECTTFTTHQGLPSDEARLVWGDGGTVWVVTGDPESGAGRGLARFDTAAYVEGERPGRWRNWFAFDLGQILLGALRVNVIHGLPNGDVLFGTDVGYTRYRPRPPEIRVTERLSNEQPFTCDTEIKPGAVTFRWEARDLEFSADEVAYRWKLERHGEELPWHFLANIGDDKRAQVTQAVGQPGLYRFQVAAGNIYYDWSKPESCEFKVLDIEAPTITTASFSMDGTDDPSPDPFLFGSTHLATFTISAIDNVTDAALTYFYQLELREPDSLTSLFKLGTRDFNRHAFDPAKSPSLRLGPGTYQLSVWAEDAAGNDAEPRFWTLEIPRPLFIALWWVYPLVAAAIAATVLMVRAVRYLRSYPYHDLQVTLTSEQQPDRVSVHLKARRVVGLPGLRQSGWLIERLPVVGSTRQLPPQPREVDVDLTPISDALARLREDRTSEPLLRFIGESLYQMIFKGETTTKLRRHLGLGRQGVRLRLRFEDPLNLAGLPWEFLHGGDDLGFLIAQSDVAIVRDLSPEMPEKPAPAGRPLKILVAWATPEDLHRLDVADEVAAIQDAFGDLVARKKAEVCVLKRARPDTFTDALQAGFDIVHFTGHGGVRAGRGVLYLEDEDHHAVSMEQEALLGLFAGAEVAPGDQPKLAVLNACQSADPADIAGVAGLAATLVSAGRLPAVVGMGYPITSESAAIFSRTFYRELIRRRGQVDRAVSRGQEALFAEVGAGQRDWGVPRLYMRIRGGVIFELT